MVAKNVGEDLVGCQTALAMKKPTQHLRPESRSGIEKDHMVLSQLEIVHKEF